MAPPAMPSVRPRNPCFSSGPCAKRPGWTPGALSDALLGRSHRSRPGRAQLEEVIDRSRALLRLPDDYRLGIVPASDTGAVEAALWSLLGPLGVDVLVWETFGAGWADDVTGHLRFPDTRVLEADYGLLPDLSSVDFDRDVVFAWNGTTSGVCVPDGDWIPADRRGLVICDATSAAFAFDLPWDRIDVATYSWQKAMGGEAAHGVLILSPRAVERLEAHTPPWPVPKVFRLVSEGRLIEGIFRGDTINTPSMLCVADALDGLKWGESIGGLDALVGRARANFEAIAAWVEGVDWVEFLAVDPATRSPTSVCLRIVGPRFEALGAEARAAVPRRIEALLEGEGVAYDINAYRSAPPGLRLWAGATVERANLEALLPWLDWAWAAAGEGAAPAA